MKDTFGQNDTIQIALQAFNQKGRQVKTVVLTMKFAHESLSSGRLMVVPLTRYPPNLSIRRCPVTVVWFSWRPPRPTGCTPVQPVPIFLFGRIEKSI